MTGEGERQAPESVDALVEMVMEKVGAPVDRWAVTATFESVGLRDADAEERFGVPDLFQLSDEVFARCRARAKVAPRAQPADGEPDWHLRLRRFMRLYVRGGFFFVPLSLQLGSVFVLGYGLWAWVNFTTRQASVVAFAVILSFVVTAGFVQSLGYLGPFFSEPGKDILTRRLTYALLCLGMALVAVVGLVWALASFTIGFFPLSDLGTGLVYYGLLSGLWLATAVLYMLRRYLAMVLTTVAGIAVVGVLLKGASATIYLSHWAGIASAVGVALLWGGVVLGVRAGRVRGDLRLARMTSPPVLASYAAPYFAYGLLYFGFLFMDRIIAWSKGGGPLPIHFLVPYEVGIEWAFMSIVLGLALLEYTIAALARKIISSQETVSGLQARDHQRDLVRFYGRNLLALAALVGAGALVANFGILWLRDHTSALDDVKGTLSSPATSGVHLWGLVGYALLAWALLNAVFLFSLGRPKALVAALLPSVVVGGTVGFVLSRSGPYWHSVFGLVVGAALFALVTTLLTFRSMQNAPYHYYAGF